MERHVFSEPEINFSYKKISDPLTTRYDAHLHENNYEIYYLLAGDLYYLVDGERYRLQAGDLLVIDMDSIHRPNFNSGVPYERVAIHFNPKWVRLYNVEGYDLTCCLNRENIRHHRFLTGGELQREGIPFLMQEMIRLRVDNSTFSQVMLRTLFIQLLLRLNVLIQDKTQNDEEATRLTEQNNRMAEVIFWLNQHYQKKITLDELSQTFFIDKYHLCHQFKQNTGFTLFEYLTYKRIFLAKTLLLSGISSSEVSSQTGFGDYSSFYRSFRKIVGISPKMFTSDAQKQYRLRS
jgi:AraC-like DNA-binding protein